MRPTILLLLSSALAGACTDEPATSPGRLEKIHDKAFACEDGSSPTWSCSTEVMIEGATIQSVGVHNNGSLNGPGSLGTLSETALQDLDALIATIPLGTAQGGEPGCGGPVSQARTFRINFADYGVRELSEATVEGPQAAFESYVAGLLLSIDTCTATDKISFVHCQPQLAPELEPTSIAQR